MKCTSTAWAPIVFSLIALVTSGCVIAVDDDDGAANEATNATTTASDSDTEATTGGPDTSEPTVSTGGSAEESTTGGADETAGADETTASDAPEYPEYAGEGTLRLLADGDDLAGHESLASDVNATESNLEANTRRVAAYFDDSGNRVILHFPADAPGEYEITVVDGGGAIVDVLLNTDATGLEQRIEGVLASGTIRLDELDLEAGRARAVWVGVMTPASASGLQADLAVAGALDVTVEVLP